MLALPVWTIILDKGRVIEPKNQSVRNGRVLTYTVRATAWIPTKITIMARDPFAIQEQRWRLKFMAGINLRGGISVWNFHDWKCILSKTTFLSLIILFFIDTFLRKVEILLYFY